MSEAMGLQLEIRENSEKAVQGLNALAASLEKIKGVVSGGLKLGSVAKQIEKLSSSVSAAIPEDSITRIERFADALERLKDIGPIKIKLSNGAQRTIGALQDVETTKDSNGSIRPEGTQTSKEDAENTGRLASLIGRLKEMASSAAPVMTAFGKGISVVASAAGGAIRGIRNLATGVLSLGRGLLKLSWKGIKNIASAAGKAVSAFREMRERISLSNTALGHLISSVQRVAFYRLIRSGIRMVTQGVQEGIQNLYRWSDAMNGSFAASMDTGASASLKFKNSIAAMLGPAIEAVIPLLVSLANVAIQAANAINQFISVIFGRSTWTKAKDVSVKSANALSGAGKAAKEADDAIKGLLADWDELNIIQNESSKNPSGGSGSGGGGGISATDMFEQVPIESNWWTDLAQELKDAINAGDWRGAGKILADKLNEVVYSLDTRAWGDKLADKLTKGLELVNGFLGNFKFKILGNKIGEFFSAVFSEDNQTLWSDIGETFRLWLIAKIEVLQGIVETEGLFDDLGTSIATAVNSYFSFSEENINDAATALGGTIKGIADAAAKALTEIDFKSIGIKVGILLRKIFGKDGTIGWKSIGNAIKQGVLSAFDLLSGLFSGGQEDVPFGINMNPHYGEVEKYLNNSFGSNEGNGFVSIINTLKQTFKSLYDDVIAPTIEWLVSEKLPPLIQGISDVFDGLSTVVKAAYPHLKNVYDNFIKPVADTVLDVAASALEALASALKKIAYWISENGETFEGLVSTLLRLRGIFIVSKWIDNIGLLGTKIAGLVVGGSGSGGTSGGSSGGGGFLFSGKFKTLTALLVFIRALSGSYDDAIVDLKTKIATLFGLDEEIARAAANSGNPLDLVSILLGTESGQKKSKEFELDATLEKTLGSINSGWARHFAKEALESGDYEEYASKVRETVAAMREAWDDALSSGLTEEESDVIKGLKAVGFDYNMTDAEVSAAIDASIAALMQYKEKYGDAAQEAKESVAQDAKDAFGVPEKEIKAAQEATDQAVSDTHQALQQTIQAWNDLGYIDFDQWSKFSDAIWENRVSSVEELRNWAKDLGIVIPEVADAIKDGLEETKSDAENAGAGVGEAYASGVAEGAQGLKDAMGVPYEELANVEEAVQAAKQNAEEVVSPWMPVITIDPIVAFDENNNEIQNAASQIDEGYVQSLYDEIYDVLNNYEPEISEVSKAGLWESVLEPLVRDLSGAYGLSEEATDNVADIFHSKWLESMEAEDWEGDLNGLLNILQDAIDDAIPDELKAPDNTAYNSAISGAAESTVNSARTAIAAIQQWMAAASAMGSMSAPRISIPSVGSVAMAAEGGVMTTGQMFIAREAGPEYVGTLGGHTAVANNDQIVSGVASGVAAGQAEQNALLRQQNDYLRQLLAKESTVRIVPSSGLGRVNQQSAEMYARQTGRG